MMTTPAHRSPGLDVLLTKLKLPTFLAVHGDAARNKPAFPSVIGLEASQRRARELCERAVDELHEFPGDTTVLEWLARYAIQRDS